MKTSRFLFSAARLFPTNIIGVFWILLIAYFSSLFFLDADVLPLTMGTALLLVLFLALLVFNWVFIDLVQKRVVVWQWLGLRRRVYAFDAITDLRLSVKCITRRTEERNDVVDYSMYGIDLVLQAGEYAPLLRRVRRSERATRQLIQELRQLIAIPGYLDPDSARQYTLSQHRDDVTSLAFSVDGQLLASGSDDKTVCVWHLTDGQLLHQFKGLQERVRALAFSRDQRYLAAASAAVYVWEVTSGQVICQLEEDTSTNLSDAMRKAIQQDPAQPMGWQDRLQSAQKAFGQMARVFNPGRATCVCFSPRRIYVAAGFSDAAIRVWKLSNGALTFSLSGHTEKITHVLFSADERFLISSANDGTVRVWDMDDGRQIHTVNTMDPVLRLIWDDDRVCAQFNTGGISIWKLESEGSLLPASVQTPPAELAVRAQGVTLEGIVRVFRLGQKEPFCKIDAHPADVTSVVLSADCRTVATGSEDRSVRVWTIPS